MCICIAGGQERGEERRGERNGSSSLPHPESIKSRWVCSAIYRYIERRRADALTGSWLQYWPGARMVRLAGYSVSK